MSTEPTTAASLAARIVDLVRARRHVSFAELDALAEAHLGTDKAHGDKALHLTGFENVLLWIGLSEVYSEAVQRAVKDGPLYYHPVSHLAYMIDGSSLTLPLAERARQYKRPHWLPVCLDTEEPRIKKILERGARRTE